MLRIAVTGAAGRMGGAFLAYLESQADVVAQFVSNAGKLSLPEKLELLAEACRLQRPDVLVDFSYPEATLAYAEWAASESLAMVVGTTGFTRSQLDRLAEILRPVPALLSPNMSLMMNLAWRMIANATAVLPHDTVDVEIVEKHHREKRNAPSSTALKIAQLVAEKRGWTLSQSLRHQARWGLIGSRPHKEIAIASLRGGTFNSEHAVIFAGQGESLEITHRSQSLEPYARGTLQASRWLLKQAPGMYDMLDMLGLQEVLY